MKHRTHEKQKETQGTQQYEKCVFAVQTFVYLEQVYYYYYYHLIYCHIKEREKKHGNSINVAEKEPLLMPLDTLSYKSKYMLQKVSKIIINIIKVLSYFGEYLNPEFHTNLWPPEAS